MREQLKQKHNFVNEFIFRSKSMLLTLIRFSKNSLSPIKKFTPNHQLIDDSIIAISESELWNPTDNQQNWILTAGKIENLRIAAKKIHGIEVKANETFSFWKHIGNPNFNKGFVVGREIREGCIVPTIAGGLCQLSNALYDAALEANFEIIERHKHTKIIPGSLAEKDRDATVKWNYLDLRFKSNHDFRIEIELTSEKLIVCFKSKQIIEIQNNIKPQHLQSDQLNDCYSCGNTSCFKHPTKSTQIHQNEITTFILDEKWPEYDEYLSKNTSNHDHFIVPLKKNFLIKTDRYNWKYCVPKNTKATTFQGIYRAIKLRFGPKQNNTFELSLELDKKIAIAAAKLIPIECTHLVISQNLLPYIYQSGALGGRTFDVFMNRLPFEKLHARLDLAHKKHPESKTLNDFRASKNLIKLENIALNKARKIITPHCEIAEIFNHKVEKLEWHLPKLQPNKIQGSKILFPASAVGRKGAYEMKQLAEDLNLEISVSGKTIENEDFWKSVKIEKFNGNYNEIGLIVYPTYVENQPRQLLKAISKGIPIISTTACGINSLFVKTINIENWNQFKIEIERWKSYQNP